MRLLLVIIFAGFLIDADAYYTKKCFAPVFCTSWGDTDDKSGSPEWAQVVPPLIENTGGNCLENSSPTQANKENVELRKDLDETQAQLNDVKDENVELRKDLDGTQSQLNDVKDENVELRKDLAGTQSQLNEVAGNYTKLVKIAQQVKLQNEMMRKIIDKTCPIFYDDKCFLPIINKRVTKTEAQNICERRGGKLADIYDKSHFNMMMEDVRKKYTHKQSKVDLWLGLKYKTKNYGKVFLSNGTEAKYKRWHPGYPRNESDYTSIYLSVNRSPDYANQYLLNFYPSNPYAYPLCET